MKSFLISLALLFSFIFISNTAYAALPAVGAISPSSGTVAPDIVKTFICTYSDADGWTNLKETKFLINPNSTALTNSAYLYYDQNANLLYLRDDTNTVWLGGYAPGASSTIENSQVKLNCASTTISGSSTTLTVNWDIAFKPVYSGKTYNTYLYVKDDTNGAAGWTKKGTYTVNRPPQVGSITPVNGTSNSNEQVTFSATYSDSDGWQNIKYVYLLFNTSTAGVNCFYGYYNQNTNKLYLKNDANTSWLGGFTPGSNNVIENSYAKLDCAKTSISGANNLLTVNWSVVFKPAFPGTKNIYLYVRDDVNAYNAWTKAGTWSIQSDTVAPTGAIKINNDNQYTNSAQVTLNLSAQDNSGGSGLSQMQFSNDGATWSAPEAYAVTKSWTLTSGNGLKTVYAKFKDAAENWSAPVSDSIFFDSSLQFESEPNNDLASANSVDLNYPIIGTLDSANNEDYFKITALKKGMLGLYLTNVPPNILAYIFLIDSSGNCLGSACASAEGASVSLQQELTSPGDYYIRINNYYNNSSIQYRLDVKLFSLWFLNVQCTPNQFSPNSDGQKDITKITANITISANWTINIKDSFNVIKRTFTGSGSSINQEWDGNDSTGAVVPDGVYTYTIDATDAATGANAPQAQGQIIVDNTLPTASITEPLAGATLSGTVAIKGIVDDTNNPVYGTLFYGKGLSPTVWNFAFTVFKTGPNPGLLANWDTTSLANGYYSLRLEVVDAAGNTKISDIPVSVCQINSFYVEPALFSPNADGIKDTVNFVAVFNKNANWTISIKNSSNTVARNFTGMGSNLSQSWDGKNNSGTLVSDGAYTYTINATDPATGQSILSGAGTIEIDNTLPSANITQPAANSKVGDVVIIKCNADDLHFDGKKSVLSYGAGSTPTQWNTISPISSPLPLDSAPFYFNTNNLKNGIYTLRLLIYDLAGNMKDIRVPVNVYNVTILSFSVSPDRFSPDNDGKTDTVTISANLSMVLNWKIFISDGALNIIRNFSGSSDTISQVWDGKNNSGQTVPDGRYDCRIEVTDPATGITVQSLSILIIADTALPVAVIMFPSENTTVVGKITITGTAADNNFSFYILEYAQNTTPDNWNLITGQNFPVTNAALAEWDTNKLSNGVYTLRLTVSDLIQNKSVFQVKINVDNVKIKISGISVNPDIINPCNNETATISYILDRNADTTIKLLDLNSNVKRTLCNLAPRNAGANTEIWDGKDDAGNILSDNAYTLAIEAQSGSAKGWYQSSGGFQYNVITASDFTFPQSFNPYNNESCAIGYTLSENAILTLLATKTGDARYGCIVNNEIRVKGAHIEYWNGRNQNGEILDYYTQDNPLILGYQSISLPENSISVVGTPAGNVDVSSDPYVFMPNFGELTTINYTISSPGNVSVFIYKPFGELVKNLLVNVSKTAGTYPLTWDGRDESGKIVNKDDNYILKAVFTDANGRTTIRQGNITIR